MVDVAGDGDDVREGVGNVVGDGDGDDLNEAASEEENGGAGDGGCIFGKDFMVLRTKGSRRPAEWNTVRPRRTRRNARERARNCANHVISCNKWLIKLGVRT